MASNARRFASGRACSVHRIVKCSGVRHQGCRGNNASGNGLKYRAVHTAGKTKIICIDDEAPHAKSLTVWVRRKDYTAGRREISRTLLLFAAGLLSPSPRKKR